MDEYLRNGTYLATSLKQEPEEEEEEGAQGGPAPQGAQQDDSQEPRKQSLLLRLFESKLFDPALAMNYLFITKEPGVLEYIGNRLFRQETISVSTGTINFGFDPSIL